MTKSPMRGVPVIIQNAQTSGDGQVLALPNTYRRHVVYIKGSVSVSAGRIQLETSSIFPYANTWAQISGNSIEVLDGAEIEVN